MRPPTSRVSRLYSYILGPITYNSEYIHHSNKKQVYFKDLDKDLDLGYSPSVKRKNSKTVSISTILDKTSCSYTQVVRLGYKKDTGSRSKSRSARRRSSKVSRSLLRVGYNRQEGCSKEE